MEALTAPLYAFLWRLLHLLLHVHTALLSWLRPRLPSPTSRLWERAVAALTVPGAATGFPGHQKTLGLLGGDPTEARRSRWLADGQALEKLPVHIGLLVAEEEHSYTDLANLVVWCMAVGISYVSVYDNQGFFRKNNSRLLEEIVRQQQELLGVDGSRYGVDFLSSSINSYQNKVVSCRPTLKVLCPADGKQSIVQAAQQLCRSVENKQSSSKDISVSSLDVLLRESKNIPDPELVLKLGPVNSTLGFLPWHIRLSEFISLPSHRNLAYEELLAALQRYSCCQQRLGQ
ncbi:dehydrodolichyl diphosphate synthase complex subunit nus1 [Salarias fasciatus]|uniref:ditrans,polycis-polyprenyl diphosphate synthase [(2E,6E)-farnesyldiphosphate specific] n=1 Tax=Salarias fasciatus TaxID=181472 RepID=A0A672F6Q6_SALFA|nr:dehydrodolichyl diphosphate synthase complex subunit NUS1 [Salarias fasciatus]